MNKIIIVVMFLVLFSINLKADTPSFDIFEFGYTTANFDDNLKKFNGVDLRVNSSLGEHFFVALDYFRVDLNGSESNLDITTLGVGYRYHISDSTTIYSEIDGVIYNLNGPGNHENGIEITNGIRSNITNQLELRAAVEVFNTKTYDMTTLVVGAAYHLSRSYAIYSNFKTESNSDRLSIGLRYSF